MNSDIEIRGLNVSFADGGAVSPAVVDVNAVFPAGTVTGLIGESGSGKSVLGMSILQLLPGSTRVAGQCLYRGQDLYRLGEKEIRQIRGREIALIPQNPSESLNPIRTIGRQLTEGVAAHGERDRAKAGIRRDALLRRFGFDDPGRINASYTFQLSGGMNQRVIAALGLMDRPRWVIADEPTKGLDAILRRQVCATLREISRSETEGMIVITHDIALAAALCGRLMVLYKGTVLEQGSAEQVVNRPLHPYTRGLIDSLPGRGMHPIPRALPERTGMTGGCRFYPRCAIAEPRCGLALPPETHPEEGRTVRCYRYA